MFFAVVIKDPNKAEEENEQEGNELSPDEEALHNKAQNSEEEKTLRKIGFVDKPPNPEKLEAARQLKMKQKEMKSIIREVLQYFVFLSVLLVVAYGSRDPMAFSVTRAMTTVFDEGKYTGLSAFDGVFMLCFHLLNNFTALVCMCALVGIAVITDVSGLTCKRGERVNLALYWPISLIYRLLTAGSTVITAIVYSYLAFPMQMLRFIAPQLCNFKKSTILSIKL